MNIVLMGPPGVGKGTQAGKIKIQYDIRPSKGWFFIISAFVHHLSV